MAKNMDLLDASIYTRHAVPWQRKRGKYVIAKMPYTAWSPSPAQLAQRIKFADAAINNRGTRGKVFYKGVNMPAIAYNIGRGVTGAIPFTVPVAEKRARREAAASSNVEQMRSDLERAGYGVGVRSRVQSGTIAPTGPAGGAVQAGYRGLPALRRSYI